MNIITLDDCYKSDYHIKFLGNVEMPQKVEAPAFSSIGYPKKQDMLLFVNECKTRYVTIDGRVINTQNGDVVYVPKGSQYRVECVLSNEKSSTFQINFLLFDQNYQPFVLDHEIVVFPQQSSHLRSLFEKSVMLGKNASVYPAMQKSVLFEILSALATSSAGIHSSSIIDDGFEYLLAHYSENPSIPEIASKCHVSCEYFRKLFKKQTGQTPSEYKNSLRIKKAEQYLLYSDLSVEKISEQLSFATVSHFIKSFKDTIGCSPLVFRNNFRKTENEKD